MVKYTFMCKGMKAQYQKCAYMFIVQTDFKMAYPS